MSGGFEVEIPLSGEVEGGGVEVGGVKGRGVEVELDVILAAEIPAPYHYVFRAPGSRPARFLALADRRRGTVPMPCLAYLLRHPAAGVILIDTGLHPDALRSVARDFGPGMGLMFRGLRPASRAFDQQLLAAGVQPADVWRVLMTHLHADHTSGMRLLPNATFSCARREWAATRGRLAAARGYVHRHLPREERMDLLDPDRDGERFGPFASTLDLFGDGSVRAISTPGHTPGHLSFLIRRRGGSPVLAVGDAAYTLQSIREQTLPLLTVDDELARRSVTEIREFIAANPEALVVPTHDPDAWRVLAA